MKAAAAAGVPRFAFISVHEFKLPSMSLERGFQERCLPEESWCPVRVTSAHLSVHLSSDASPPQLWILSSWVASAPRLPHLISPRLAAGGWHAQDFLLKGYFQGKRDAEAELAVSFPTGGVALRPGFIHGERDVGSVSLPLSVVGTPWAKVEAMNGQRAAKIVPKPPVPGFDLSDIHPRATMTHRVTMRRPPSANHDSFSPHTTPKLSPCPPSSPSLQLLSALPSQSLADLPIVGAAFVPPVPVEVVGRAAVAAVLDASVPPGIMDVVSGAGERDPLAACPHRCRPCDQERSGC